MGYLHRRLDTSAAAWDPAAEAPAFDSRSDALNNLFVLEKDLVFAILRKLGIEPSPQEREAIERVPTRNLQAFLAYSRGMMEEDAGRFKAAARQFRRAAALDPGFSQAVEQAEATASLAETSPSAQNAASTMAGVAGFTPDDLLTSRQQNLGTSVGSIYLPGEDTRDTPAEEARVLLPRRARRLVATKQRLLLSYCHAYPRYHLPSGCTPDADLPARPG